MQNIVNQVYNDPQNRVNAPKDADMFNDLTAFEEVLRLYNTAVEPYNGIRANLTQQTKGEILNKVRKLLNPVAYITNGIKNIIEKEIRKYESANGAVELRIAQVIKKRFPRLVDTLVCYNMIYDQLRSGNLSPISRSELGSEIKFTIDHVQNINEIFTELDMKSLFSTSGDPYFGAILPSGELRQALFEIKPTEPATSPRVAPTGPVVPPEAPVAAPGAPYRTVDPDLRFGTPKDSTGAYAPPEAELL